MYALFEEEDLFFSGMRGFCCDINSVLSQKYSSFLFMSYLIEEGQEEKKASEVVNHASYIPDMHCCLVGVVTLNPYHVEQTVNICQTSIGCFEMYLSPS